MATGGKTEGPRQSPDVETQSGRPQFSLFVAEASELLRNKWLANADRPIFSSPPLADCRSGILGATR
jgi:hypothetical protein